MRLTLFGAAGIWFLVSLGAAGQITLTPSAFRNHPNIAYLQTPPDDAVARLDRRLKRGEASLDFNEGSGYLKSVLAALGVPAESQLLVFSKTSFQASRINPTNPRALYFNDTVAVGWVRGGEVLEFIAQDPAQGAMFYTLAQSAADPPRFTRNGACIQCHSWEATLNVPGMFAGSVYPDKNGMPGYAPTYATDHRTPFPLRWGGWYVNGRHRAERHLGNAWVTDQDDVGAMVTPATVHSQTLSGKFDAAGYLSVESDIVALLVLEHQMRMLNLITRLGWEARIGADAAGRPLGAAVDELVDYLLFVDEEGLPGPISGASTFATTFSARGPRDHAGRSLRDLNLGDRLFQYPCSYLIYSEPFDALPDVAKRAVYARMWDVLSGHDSHTRYRRLTALDRRAIVGILRETKDDLPSYFSDERPDQLSP